MEQIPLSHFQKNLHAIIETVVRPDKPVLIMDEGKSLVKIVPVPSSEQSWLGCMKGTGEIIGDIISPVEDLEVWEKYPDSKIPLIRWFKIMDKQDFGNFVELRVTFPSADQVGDLTVFNIGGNKYRLIVAIHFNRGKVYIRHVLTHAGYDKGGWKK